MTINDLLKILPENIILLGLIVLPILELLRLQYVYIPKLVSIIFIIASFLATIFILSNNIYGVAFHGQYEVSELNSYLKLVIIGLSFLAFIFRQPIKIGSYKYFFFILSVIYGSMIVTSATTFITLFIGLELIALPLYVLVLNYHSFKKATEASMKYIFLDAVTSSSFLIAVAFIYFAKGSLQLSVMAGPLLIDNPYLAFGTMVLLIALFTKLSLALFHVLFPDIMEGSDYRVLYLLAVISKLATFYMLLNILSKSIFPASWIFSFGVLAIISTVWGNLAMFVQSNLKRFLAYSSIAHVGYLLLVLLLSNLSNLSIQYSLISWYFILYAISLFLVLFPISLLQLKEDSLLEMDKLYYRSPKKALLITFGILSLAGIPPFPGFWAKIAIMGSVIDAGYTEFAVIALIASYLGIYPYFRFMGRMYLFSTNKGEESLRP